MFPKGSGITYSRSEVGREASLQGFTEDLCCWKRKSANSDQVFEGEEEVKGELKKVVDCQMKYPGFYMN